MSRYLEVPQEKVGERLDTLIRLAHEGARIVIKKDGIAQAYIQPANPNMSEDMYEALLALRSIPSHRTSTASKCAPGWKRTAGEVGAGRLRCTERPVHARRGARGDGCPASAGIHRQLRYACLPIGISKVPMACFAWNALDSWPRRRLRSSYGRWIDSALLADTPPTAERATAIHKLAQNHGLTAYDAAYVELTIRSGSDLATFDRKLGCSGPAA